MPVPGVERALRSQAREASARRARRSDTADRLRARREAAAGAQPGVAGLAACASCELDFPVSHLMQTGEGQLCDGCYIEAETHTALARGKRQDLRAMATAALPGVLTGLLIGMQLSNAANPRLLISGKPMVGWLALTSVALISGLVSALLGARQGSTALKQPPEKRELVVLFAAALTLVSGLASLTAAVLGWAIPLGH